MRLGLLADIHGNVAALARVLDAFRAEGICKVLFLGDLVGYYPFTSECIAMLDDFEIEGVRGNHDQVAIDCIKSGIGPDPSYREAYGTALERTLDKGDPAVEAFLLDLPLSRMISFEECVLRLDHGSPWDPLEGRVYPDFENWSLFDGIEASACVLGHTHYPMRRAHGDVQIINPGSVGQARHRSGFACGAVIETNDAELNVSFLELPYDVSGVLDDARRNNPHVPYVFRVLER